MSKSKKVVKTKSKKIVIENYQAKFNIYKTTEKTIDFKFDSNFGDKIGNSVNIKAKFNPSDDTLKIENVGNLGNTFVGINQIKLLGHALVSLIDKLKQDPDRQAKVAETLDTLKKAINK